MLIIIAIFLTIWAYKRGWEGMAFLPIAISIGIMVLIGVSSDSLDVFTVLCIIALIIMIIGGHKEQKVSENKKITSKKKKTKQKS